jgi:C_GCAxxG_C_C family probable redox protein
METENNFNDIQASAMKRMHRYTCAEASLQAFMELFNMPRNASVWACAGYGGAILSGHATCGLLIGSGIAISMALGRGKNCLPEQDELERSRAIQYVANLYKDFSEKFGSTRCTDLSRCDWNKPDDITLFVSEKRWKVSCDVQMQFILECGKTLAEELMWKK